MGFDIDRFPDVNHELICCICTGVLEDPIESPCRHVFCSDCIKTWLSTKKTCPSCRSAVRRRDLRPVVLMLKNIISKQRMYCDNKAKGCEEIVELEQLTGHVANCKFSEITCENEGCNVFVLRKDYNSHAEICPRKMVVCNKGCDVFMTLGEREGHNCIQALKSHFQSKIDIFLTFCQKKIWGRGDKWPLFLNNTALLLFFLLLILEGTTF